MENQYWNQLIQDVQKCGVIIKICDKNYRYDVMKILKFKFVLQRSFIYFFIIVLEVFRFQGGLFSSKLDSGFVKIFFVVFLYYIFFDFKEIIFIVILKDFERFFVYD